MQKSGTHSLGLAIKDGIICDGASRLNVDGMGWVCILYVHVINNSVLS